MNPFSFVSDWRTHQLAVDAYVAAADTRDETRSTARVVRDLEARVDRLEMACEAMWTIIKGELKCGDEDIARLVRDIDLRDGKVDGRYKPPAPPCRRCERGTSVRTGVCLYCGNPAPREEIDEG